MAIEHASTRVVTKPWGRSDLRPWSDYRSAEGPVGEIWFQRDGDATPSPELLLKLLFTEQALSIQVHPTDAFAQASGLPSGKSEAWYIVCAAPDSKIALGLKRSLSRPQLRAAIQDHSIADLLQWHGVVSGDFINVPAGTIHAIGKGLVVAEIQHGCDVTFRLFDWGRLRELHINEAVATATAGPAVFGSPPTLLTPARMLLVATPHFVVERIELAPQSNWRILAEKETWMLVLDGDARIGLISAFTGETVFLEADHTSIRAGAKGMVGLLAYPGPKPLWDLLRSADAEKDDEWPRCDADAPTVLA